MRAFTLLEILAVIGLIGLLVAVLAVGASQVMVKRAERPEDVVWTAIGEARKYALRHETEVRLSFDNDEQVFRASTPQGAVAYPVPKDLGKKLELEFLGMARGERSILVGGVLLEANPLSYVTFYGDGTCTPFRIQLRTGIEAPLVLEIDPWTCAPMLRPDTAG